MGDVSARPVVGARQVIGAWTAAGARAGLTIGAVCGSFPIPIIGTAVGAIIGLLVGLLVGFLDGLLLAFIHPAPRYAPLIAAAATELILLPVQVWLWLLIHHWQAYLLLVWPVSAVSVGVAAWFGRRLPPGAGSRLPASAGDLPASTEDPCFVEEKESEMSPFPPPGTDLP
jgi:hypothetical protein